MHVSTLSKYSCLARTDNTSPFRWMGVWCAVYAPGVQLKAERGSERTCRRRRRHRPANRRGKGSSFDRRERRALARSVPRKIDVLVPHAMERSMKRLNRIDYLDRRFSSYVSRTLTTLASEGKLLEDLGRSYENQSKGKGLPHESYRLVSTTADYLEGLSASRYLGIRRMTERLVRACSGHWGYPHDVTLRRLRMVTEKIGGTVYLSDDPVWRAVPRVRTAELKRWEREKFPAPQFTNDALMCHCRGCRVSTLCSSGHSVSAGCLNCRWCDWVRHVGGAFRIRESANRRGEGNHPLRFCRQCGFVTCRCERKAPPRLRGAKAKPRK